MHCELVVPGLLSAPPAERLPAVELLLARARCTSADRRSLEAWLHQAFELGEQPLAAGALTALSHEPSPQGEWARADPVHLRLMRDHLVLIPAAALDVQQAEAEALCAALNAHFAERMQVQAIDAARWVARLAEALSGEAEPPLELSGRPVALGAAQAGGSRAHQLLNESQMILHAHAVNEAREARGEPTINSLWLWGGGRLPIVKAGGWHSVSANDPLVLGLARAAGLRHWLLGPGAAAWLERAPQDGRHLVLLDALRVPLALSEMAGYQQALLTLERDWFAPLLGALRAGCIAMITLQVPDAAASLAYETVRSDLRRFWKRPKALENYA